MPLPDGFVKLHEMNAGGGHVVHVQKLSPRFAAAPNGDKGSVVLFGFVEAPEEGGDDVAVLRVVVIAGAVQVCGHDGAVVGSVLTVATFAYLDTGDLGDGVRLVGRLQRAGEQRILGDWLRGKARVDTRRAQKEQPSHAGVQRRRDDVVLDGQILENEVGRVGVVGVNASYLGGGQIDLVDALLGEKARRRRLVEQVEFGAGTQHQILITTLCQSAHQRRADHSAMAGDVDRVVQSIAHILTPSAWAS